MQLYEGFEEKKWKSMPVDPRELVLELMLCISFHAFHILYVQLANCQNTQYWKVQREKRR